VVVVGAGATGVSAALALLEHGKRVLVVDPVVEKSSQGLVAALPISLRRRPALRHWLARASGQLLQSQCYAWDEDPAGFVSDRDLPYGGEGFVWVRGARLGGRMSLNGHGRKFPRFDAHELQATVAQSVSHWPLELASLTSHYAALEELLAIRQPPVGVVERGLATMWPGSSAQTLPIGDFSAALKKFQSHKNLIFLRDARVSHLNFSANTGQLESFTWTTCATGALNTTEASCVFLAASPFESNRILLASQLRGAHPQLGRCVMDHVKSTIEFPWADRTPTAPCDFYVSHQGPRSGLTFGVQAYCGGDSRMRLSAFGPMQPRLENFLELQTESCDAWGLRTLRIVCEHGAHDRDLAEDQREFLEIAARGASRARTLAPGLACHEAGGLRMGWDASTSVVDPSLRLWNHNGVYVVDASVFPSVGRLNPTLTAMALARRAALHWIQCG